MRLFAARLVDQVIVVHHHLVRHARVLFDAIESLSQEAVQIVFGLHVRIQKVNVLELSAIAIGGHNYFTMVLIING
jgi:two-component SAPR family response regulator